MYCRLDRSGMPRVGLSKFVINRYSVPTAVRSEMGRRTIANLSWLAQGLLSVLGLEW